MQIWFWLLLPIAAASGWWAAQYSHAKKHATSKAVLNSAYGRGLNYLLNEEPDKATEVLIQLVEVDPDTIELHLALGSLFRRRGEIDRAIRVHQNVVARSMLSHSLRAQATLELGRDFLKAGLLDRAEQLFCQLLERGECETEARQHLVEVYQQEKEWEKAIAVARHLVQLDADGWAPRLAQYCCELAEDALEQGETAVALQRAGEALSEDPGCVRATLVKGRLLMDEGQYQAALDSYTAVLNSRTRHLCRKSLIRFTPVIPGWVMKRAGFVTSRTWSTGIPNWFSPTRILWK